MPNITVSEKVEKPNTSKETRHIVERCIDYTMLKMQRDVLEDMLFDRTLLLEEHQEIALNGITGFLRILLDGAIKDGLCREDADGWVVNLFNAKRVTHPYTEGRGKTVANDSVPRRRDKKPLSQNY